MSNFITRKIREYRCKKSLKCYCEPGEGFLCETKKLFLDKIAPEGTAKKVRLSWFSLREAFKYSLASFFSLVFLSGGAAVYADKANVAYNHPLYNLKRVAEAVRVEMAPKEQLPVLHTELAQRRLDEIKTIEADVEIMAKDVATTTENVATTTKYMATTTKNVAAPKEINEKIKAEQKKRQDLMFNLRNQMRQEVSSVMNEIEQKPVEKTSAQKLCNSVSQIMKEDEQTDGGETEATHAERWNKLQKNCGEFINASSTSPFERGK